MNDKDLIEHVSMLADMEDNIYLKKNLLAELKKLSNGYGLPSNISKPSLPVLRIYSDRDDIGCGGVITFVIIGALLCFWGIKLLASPSLLAFLPGICLTLSGGCIVLVALVMTPNAFKGKQQEKEAASQYKIDMKNYDEAMIQYEQDLLDDKARVTREIIAKKFIESEIESVERRLSESQKRLQEMYNFGVVYPKYRNLVMINSICEYLKSGRCNSLDGPDGAYNILENEMRLDRIILQLDQVIERLDQIRMNQYLLYSAIQTANNTAREIIQSIKEIATKIDSLTIKDYDYTEQIQAIQATSSLTAYNIERVNKELHYMNRMKYYAGEYSSTFFNQLP